MKKAISVFLVLVILLGLSACTKTSTLNEVVAEANKNIKACQSHLDGLPLILSGKFDEETKIYTLTLAISNEEDYKNYIYHVHYENLIANGFNSLSSIQQESVLALLMNKLDKCGSTEKEIFTLAMDELPMEEFKELGITVTLVYQDRNGIKTVVDKNITVAD